MTPHPSPLLLTGARLLDPESGTAAPDSWLLVQEGRITGRGSGPAPARENTETVDLAGATLMPGLIDAHVHATAFSADLGAAADQSASYVTAWAAASLSAMLGRGFTTVRDVGGADWGLAQALEDGLIDGPHLAFGGRALSQTGGHGDFRPRGRHGHGHGQDGCCPGSGLVCDGPVEFRRAAREQLRTGAHHVKVMLSGGVASPTDRIDSTQSSEDELRAVVEGPPTVTSPATPTPPAPSTAACAWACAASSTATSSTRAASRSSWNTGRSWCRPW